MKTWYVKSNEINKESGTIKNLVLTLLLSGIGADAAVNKLVNENNVSYDQAKQIVREVETEHQNYSGPQPLQYTVTQSPQQNNTGINIAGLIQEIKRHEGFELYVYDDVIVGKKALTIGYGYNLANSWAKSDLAKLNLNYYSIINKTTSINEVQAEALLKMMLTRSITTATNYAPDFANLPGPIKEVLINMCYNLGDKINLFKDMKKAIAKKDWNGMANEMQNSLWYTQTGDRSKYLVNKVRNFAIKNNQITL